MWAEPQAAARGQAVPSTLGIPSCQHLQCPPRLLATVGGVNNEGAASYRPDLISELRSQKGFAFSLASKVPLSQRPVFQGTGRGWAAQCPLSPGLSGPCPALGPKL